MIRKLSNVRYVWIRNIVVTFIIDKCAAGNVALMRYDLIVTRYFGTL